jgi:cell shape-determining protein MreC
MVKVALFALLVALLAVMFQMVSPDLAKLHDLKQQNQALAEQVEVLEQQLAVSEAEQQRLREALEKAQAARVERLYE